MFVNSYRIAKWLSRNNTLYILRYRWNDLATIYKLLFVMLLAFFAVLIPFTFKMSEDQKIFQGIRCLAMNIYHEARGEPQAGKIAVAEVTMNRVVSNKFPNDICGVVFQRGWSRKRKRYIGAFSWTNDGYSNMPEESKAWLNAVSIAKRVYHKQLPNKTKGALFYHADSVKPYWAAKKNKTGKIGHHIFYQ